jgi:hypothetical protein
MADEATPTSDSTPDPTPTPAPEASKETFSKEYVQELRQEAAKQRTAKKQAVDDAKAEAQAELDKYKAGADTKYGALQTELGEAWITIQKLHTAIAEGVPTEKLLAFVEVLKGTDEETIKQSAQTAKELFGDLTSKSPEPQGGRPPAYDPTHGHGSKNELPLNGDPLLNTVKKLVGVK